MVTGLAGFVGSYLLRALLARGDEVCGFGLGGSPARTVGVSWKTGDIIDGAAVAEVVRTFRPSRIVHLAGQSSAAVSFREPVETYRTNVIGTWNLLDVVARHAPGARVLIVGTGEVYGPQPEGSRVGEDSPFRPVSPYALSKAAADALSDALSRRHAVEVLRTRSFGHTGPGQAATFAIPSFAKQLAEIEAGRTEPKLRVGNLDVTRDLTDVRDVVDGYVALLDHGRPGQAYNVCRGEGVRLSRIVAQMVERCRATVRVEVDPERVRPADLPWLVGDPGAIERDAGWRARIPLERTLEDVLEEWRGRTSPP